MFDPASAPKYVFHFNKSMNLCLHSNARLACAHSRQSWHRAAAGAVVVPASSNRRPCRGQLQVRALGFDFGDEERDSRLAAEPRRPSPKAFAAYTLVCMWWWCCFDTSSNKSSCYMRLLVLSFIHDSIWGWSRCYGVGYAKQLHAQSCSATHGRL